MRRLQFKFPSQIRISGWDFGSSARAMNQAGGKDSLMTYESVPNTQAEIWTVQNSTTERKTMSTKTSIKRIALVAVAALGFGMMSTTSSQAAFDATPVNDNFNCFVASDGTATACSGIAGPANYVTVKALTKDVYVVLTGGTFSDATTAKTLASGSTANILTPSAGTITAKGYAITAGVASATAQTVTITVAAAASGTVYAGQTVTPASVAVAGTIYTYTNAATGSITRLASGSALITTELYSFTVTQTDANNVPLVDASTKAVTASLSGPGSLSLNGTQGVGGYVAAPAGATNGQIVYVYADGRAGKSTLTISVNGVAVKTYDFTFWGSATSYSVAIDQTAIAAGGTAGSATVTALDSLGSVVPNATYYPFTSASTTASVVAGAKTTDSCVAVACTADEWGVFGTDSLAVTGVSKGSATISVGNASTLASSTISASSTAKVTGAQAATVTWSFDKDEYLPGEKATITVTLKDSDGNAVGDDTYTLWGTVPTSNVATTAISGFGANIAVVSGVKTYTYYMPAQSGVVTFTGKLAADADLATALQGATVSLSANVANPADGAIDAANEATDAANAATDAANAAAEAADAATAAAQDAQAAVAALATQVASLIAGIKAQITTLTNLVIKIQKKVRA